MAIPDKPLELDIDEGEMTLNDWALFDPETNATLPAVINNFRRFLEAHSASWTKEEIGLIESSELTTVMEKVVDAMKAKSVPLASSPSSKTGQE